MKRKGPDFTCCGLVDARQATCQRLQQSEQPNACQFTVSVAMVEEWESFQRSFRLAVHARTDLNGKELEMGVPLLPSNWLHPESGLHPDGLHDCKDEHLLICPDLLCILLILLIGRHSVLLAPCR